MMVFNKRVLRWLIYGVTVGMFLGQGWAQDTTPDSILQSYTLAIESLNEATANAELDGPLSREALDRAQQTLRPLSRDTSSATLIGALEATFDRAVTAIQNQSPTDLAVQVAVLKGGVQRLVYESALRAANDDNLELARERLTAIATDMNFSESALSSMASVETFPRVIASFDIGTAEVAQQFIGSASEQSTNKELAYQNLANAYGSFLPVQDSPRVAATVNEEFTQAFSHLLNDQQEDLGRALSSLSLTMAAFETEAQNALSGTEAIAVPTPPEAAPEIVDDPVDNSDVNDSAVNNETDDPASTNESVLADVVADSPPESSPETAANDAPQITANALETAVRDLDYGNLLSAFEDLGVNPAQRDTLADSYLSSGINSVEQALDTLYVNSGRALVAIESGDMANAKAHISNYLENYRRYLSPLIVNKMASVDTQTDQLVASLVSSPSLRLQDGAVLVGQINSISDALEGTEPSATHNALLSTSLIWSGWVRLIVTLILGILAFIPLRLLNLAFGGANRNWRLIGIALFLLLLPIIYEGLSSLAALLSSALNLDALNTLSVFSLFQNTISQVIWVGITGLAIALAIAGLYGICVQFGLLGGGSTNETIISTQEMPVRSSDTSPDWDEEF